MHDYDTAAERRTDTTDIIVASDGAEILEDDPYTEHRESPDVGGEAYVRCEACGRELLKSLGGRDALVHTDGCPHGEGR
jgi:hypothetical protein